jgi:hypothetical protein
LKKVLLKLEYLYGISYTHNNNNNKNSNYLGYPGLEPGTNRLKAEYSTIELVTPSIALRISIINNPKNRYSRFTSTSPLPMPT